MNDWTRWEYARPAADSDIEVITETGMQASYHYHKGLLFLPDWSMYAYVQPALWRYAEEKS